MTIVTVGIDFGKLQEKSTNTISLLHCCIILLQGERPSSLFDAFFYGKGKAIPLQTLTGPEGSRSLRLPDFKTIGS